LPVLGNIVLPIGTERSAAVSREWNGPPISRVQTAHHLPRTLSITVGRSPAHQFGNVRSLSQLCRRAGCLGSPTSRTFASRGTAPGWIRPPTRSSGRHSALSAAKAPGMCNRAGLVRLRSLEETPKIGNCAEPASGLTSPPFAAAELKCQAVTRNHVLD
jgi:hypothetical protein